MSEAHDLGVIAGQFQISGNFVAATPYGSGHINDTSCAVFEHAGTRTRYILQRINHNIFKQPVAVMENIQRVTSHLATQVSDHPDHARRVLTLIPAHDEKFWHVDEAGNTWRAYRFIENAHTYDVIDSPEQAFQAAQAFGHFQKSLANLPAPRLHEVILDFHNTPQRFTAFEQVISVDSCGRAASALPEIQFALARKSLADALTSAGLPERVTHNDTKFNNLLLDDTTGEGLCVIDLDTVMPGLALNDFGDMVRTATSPTPEDEQNLSRVTMQFPMFEALVRGYLTATHTFLTSAEKDHLVTAAKVITYEQGLRFLTDYLAGDTYYKVHHPTHNLDRCRTQFKLLESIEQQETKMHRLVQSIQL